MNSKFLLPFSILVAGVVVALALVVVKSRTNENAETVQSELLFAVRSITPQDHYLGNPKAEAILLEYSDYDCSFCAGFFQNMSRIMDELGKTGKIVWVHRHMPLYQIHESAKYKANLTECAANLGGEEAFWMTSELLYTNALDGTRTDYEALAKEAKLDKTEFYSCLEEGRFYEKVNTEYEEAYSAGGRGTPFIIIIKGDERYAINESLPYFELRSLVESLVEE